MDRVYYLHGDDDYRKELIVRQDIERTVDAAMRDFNVEVRRGHELDAATLAGLLDALPMMAARRVVVVRDVDALKKPARAALDHYLARASEETILLLVAAAEVKPDATLTKQATAVAVESFTEEELEKWLITTAEKMGATLDAAEDRGHDIACRGKGPLPAAKIEDDEGEGNAEQHRNDDA